MVRRCPLQIVTAADALISSVKVLAALMWAEADRHGKSTGWRCISASQGWRCISASLGLARQSGRYRNTWQAVHYYLTLLHPTCHAYTRIHQPIPFLSWASRLDLHKVSALGSRVGWIPVRNNEQTNKCTTARKSQLKRLCSGCIAISLIMWHIVATFPKLDGKYSESTNPCKSEIWGGGLSQHLATLATSTIRLLLKTGDCLHFTEFFLTIRPTSTSLYRL